MFARATAGLLGGLCILGTGCSFLLPKDKEQVESPWVSFSEAKSAYDEIVPGETTVAGLQELGFDPRRTPNVEELSYIDRLRDVRVRNKDLTIVMERTKAGWKGASLER